MFVSQSSSYDITIPGTIIPNFLIRTSDTDVLTSYFVFLSTCLPYKNLLKLFNSYLLTNTIDLSIFSSKVNLEDKIKVKAQFLNYFIP